MHYKYASLAVAQQRSSPATAVSALACRPVRILLSNGDFRFYLPTLGLSPTFFTCHFP